MDLFESQLRVEESSIDFPSTSLCPAIWRKQWGKSGLENSFVLTNLAENKIWDALGQYPRMDLKAIAEVIHVVGSITTNLYTEDTDVDVHIQPYNVSKWSDEDIQAVQVWYDENRDRLGMFIGSHPIEVYIQTNKYQDLLSEGVYDLIEKIWLKGPKIVPMDYDPYKDFSHVLQDVRTAVGDVDKLFGEIRRDVIDYEVILQALRKMPRNQRAVLQQHLQDKLDEIESEIEELTSIRKDWLQKRKMASQPVTAEEALKDAQMSREWKDANAFFKFVDRYHYLQILRDLKEIGDEGVDSDDIPQIKRVVGVSNVS